jgi:hypothetical protein
MEDSLKKWEDTMQTDQALQERLHRLDSKGYPVTRKGDLLCLQVRGTKSPIIVSWNGKEVNVDKRPAKKPFLIWSLSQRKFDELFISRKTLPVLVAMNKDQANIKAGSDHHNGALVVSFLVMLQECMQGG